MKKRWPVLLLTLVMLLLFVPAGVLADDPAEVPEEAWTAAETPEDAGEAETAEPAASDGAVAETTASSGSGTCGEHLTWTLDDDGTLTISGTGAMEDYGYNSVPWYSKRSSVKRVVINSGVTSIGNYAFYYCSSLTSITIPNSVTSIGDLAFYYCSSLTNITIPDSVTSIGESAFCNCTGLTSVTIGNGVTSIGNDTFYGCSSLTSITIPDSVTNIEDFAFYGCTGLTSITIGDGVTSFNGLYPEYCPNLKSVVIGDSVTSIDAWEFENCTSLTSVTIGNGVTGIGYHAFEGCTGLTSVTIGNGVTSIGYRAFYGCTSLTTVRYTGEETNWDSIEIQDGNDNLIFAARNSSIHSYTGTHVAATCTDCGYTLYTCACGSTYIEAKENEEPAAGHRFANASGNNWVCSVCGKTSSASGLNNLSDHTYSVWASTVKSDLVETSAGKLLTIWSSGGCVLNVETRNAAGTLESSRQIVLDYPIFGGFYEGADAYYVACGQDNPNEDDRQAVIRVIRYSKAWVRQGAATLYGANTTVPFDAGSLRMTEAGGKLYVYTCHEMYQTSDGLNHQANLTMVADENTMEVVDSYSIIMNNSRGYVSHSFNQFIQTDGTYVYRADHGDAYPRAIYLSKCSVDGSITDVSYCDPYQIHGRTGANATGVSVGGMELSADNVLIAANSVDMTDESTYDSSGQRNILLTVTDKNLEATNVVWLTDYTGSEGITVGTPFLVKLDEDRFMLLWEESRNGSVVCVKEAITDENGNVRYTATLQNYRLSDCQPVVTADGNVRWFTRDSNGNTQVYKLSAHSWDSGRLAQPMTADQDGLVVYTCRTCGETRTVTLPAGGSPFIDVQNSDEYYYEPVLWAAANGIVYGTSDFEFSPNVTCTRAQVVTFLYRAAGEPAVSGSNPFTDVSSGEYYYDAVRWGYQNGIVYGTSDTTFSPDAKVTRAQFITFLYRFAQEPTPSGAASPFRDVPAGEYYTDAVRWGYQNGIVYGTSDTTFAPNDSCTRAQVVTFLHRYLVK